MAHTPGPWTSDWDDNGFFTINPTRGYVMGNEGDQSADDARLMAAAPELLEAAKSLENWLNAPQDDPANSAIVVDCRAELRAAIAKATGGA